MKTDQFHREIEDDIVEHKQWLDSLIQDQDNLEKEFDTDRYKIEGNND